jgi:hypothetical protein
MCVCRDAVTRCHTLNLRVASQQTLAERTSLTLSPSSSRFVPSRGLVVCVQFVLAAARIWGKKFALYVYMDCLLKRRQGCEDRKRPRQIRTILRFSTKHTHKHKRNTHKHKQRLTTGRRQEAGKRDQETKRLRQRNGSPLLCQWTGPVADERPREAE